MATIYRLEEIEAWKKARVLRKSIKKLAEKGEFRKDFYLKDQVKRSSGSIMDNIAEGFERDGSRELLQFLSIVKGSTGELRSQMYATLDLEYINEEEHKDLSERCIEISKILHGLMKYIKSTDMKGLKYKNNSHIVNGLKLGI